ncbi:DNA replication licensing factor MCM4 [Marchantia polymorpha subsp. ruderalis]|uniref:DNA replication licensing factor MCM4 n=2 Tax=Marchantia polymorpha TaxID=3197 RepID=A0A176VIJ1_MARPO|nr:hypothetical protein AXG93_3960s1130 [Marchantia polymorpha subsp. ruderalis]PTQ47863.1 hypothetical protein MARPO_0007s0227 [Marchantia polymorpha]BBN04176.1 hypothetical protein Mp_3g02380 [Marchantia polymorpha subsp. ruderalis]|eukprot:PTQ47863.1 hypothetical protein MARPO_0007s0227 [Marchantia polymorpha]
MTDVSASSPHPYTDGPSSPGSDAAEPTSSGGQRRRERRRSVSRASSGGYPSSPLDFGTPNGTPQNTPNFGGTPNFGTPITPRNRHTPLYNANRLSSGIRRRFRQPATSPGATQTGPSSEGGEPELGAQQLVWGTNICVEDVERAVERFIKYYRDKPDDLEAKYMKHLEQIITEELNTLNIDARDLWNSDEDLYVKMVRYPLEILAIFDIQIGKMEKPIAEAINPNFDNHIQVRFYNLKESVNMRDLNPSDIEKMVSVKGMIIRCSAIIPEIKEAFFKCLVCGYSPLPVAVERGLVDEPTRCPREECAARNSMSLIHNRCRFADKQLVRLQETPDAIPEGETPHTVSLCMYDTLVDAAKPGDRVEVTGIFRAMAVRLGPAQRTLKSLYRTYIDCLHLKKQDNSRMQAEDPLEQDQNNDYFSPFPESNRTPEESEAQIQKLKELSQLPDIYERLTRSLAPSIWELEDIKKGLLCQLFGGSVKKLSSGASFRGDINVLLVGDPGTSKSQLLQYVHKLAPRGIYTSGRGSSAVGLTAYVTKDPETKEMVLESGALVLSDRGICCIDEFDKMSDNARSMLHEVMEQQTVSVAKSGIIASLNARTSVLACANPSGSRYNPRLSVIDNIHLPPTLLSRFDLIYLVLDKPDEQNDRRLARHLVALHFLNPQVRIQESLDLPTLTSYISYARQHCHPKLSDEAAEDLINGYVAMRRKGNFPGSSKKVITATPRQLESIIRLSEALARVRLSDVVERRDAAEALRLMDVALQQSATDHATGTIDMDLITTGVSASERARRSNLVAAVRSMISEKLQAGNSFLKAPQLLEDMRKDSTGEITLNDLRNALASLAVEGFISLQGDTIRRI